MIFMTRLTKTYLFDKVLNEIKLYSQQVKYLT